MKLAKQNKELFCHILGKCDILIFTSLCEYYSLFSLILLIAKRIAIFHLLNKNRKIYDQNLNLGRTITETDYFFSIIATSQKSYKNLNPMELQIG
jgi:hypothetical protein